MLTNQPALCLLKSWVFSVRLYKVLVLKRIQLHTPEDIIHILQQNFCILGIIFHIQFINTSDNNSLEYSENQSFSEMRNHS